MVRILGDVKTVQNGHKILEGPIGVNSPKDIGALAREVETKTVASAFGGQTFQQDDFVD